MRCGPGCRPDASTRPTNNQDRNLPALDGCGVRAAVSALVISARSTAGTLHGAGQPMGEHHGRLKPGSNPQVLSRCRVWINRTAPVRDLIDSDWLTRHVGGIAHPGEPAAFHGKGSRNSLLGRAVFRGEGVM